MGNQRDRDQVQGAYQREAGEDIVDKVRGALAGADSGNEGARLAEVVGDVVRLHHDGDVEVGEEDDAQHVEQLVPRVAGRSAWDDGLQEAVVLHPLRLAEQHGRRKDGAGEDDRHDAAGVHLEGQMAGLAAHHAPADDAPRALDGNAPLAALDKDDESHPAAMPASSASTAETVSEPQWLL